MTSSIPENPASAVAATPLPRCNVLQSAWALYTFTLRQHRHGKRWLIMAGLVLLPALLSILARATDPGVSGRVLEFDLAFMFIPQGLLPLLALVYASGILHDEQEQQTITYLLLRPVSRPLLYVVKLLAAMTAAVVLALVSTTLTYAAIYTGQIHLADAAMRCLQACLIDGLAVATYCCFFGLLGLLTRRVLVAGIIYIALVEGLLANLPFAIRLITVIYYTRLIAYRALPFVVPGAFGNTHNIAADAWHFHISGDPTLAHDPHTWMCVTVLLGGGALCTAAAALLCRNREFYVKTPDKA